MRSSSQTAKVEESQLDVTGRGGNPSGQSPVVKSYPVTDLAQTRRIDAIIRQKLAAGFQAKLTVGKPNDPYEQEADRMAAQVMSMAPPDAPNVQRQDLAANEESEVQTKPLATSITPLVQRDELPEEEEESVQPKLVQRQEMLEEEEPVQPKLVQRDELPEEEESPVQMKRTAAVQASADTSGLASQLQGSKGGGSPLAKDTRSFMESRFNTDFSHVRVHTDTAAVQMNQDLNAQAFAHGRDVYFGAGKAPGQNELTAHELTHVLQQTGQQPIQRSGLNRDRAKLKLSPQDPAKIARKSAKTSTPNALNGVTDNKENANSKPKATTAPNSYPNPVQPQIPDVSQLGKEPVSNTIVPFSAASVTAAANKSPAAETKALPTPAAAAPANLAPSPAIAQPPASELAPSLPAGLTANLAPASSPAPGPSLAGLDSASGGVAPAIDLDSF